MSDAKRCTKCGEVKSLGEFYPDARRNLGVASRCKECRRAAAAEKWAADPNRARAAQQAYRAPIRDCISAYNAAYRAANQERRRAYNTAYRAANRGTPRDACELYRARRVAATIERVYRAKVWDRDGGVCYLCGLSADPNNWHLDHIVPLARGGAHAYRNVAVTHPACNLSKGTKTVLTYWENDGDWLPLA